MRSQRRYDPNGIVIDDKLRARFWAKVCKTEGCWEWTAHKTPFGHGVIQTQTPRRCPKRAHVISLLMHGVIIDLDLVVDHICKNPACVRPDHLRQVMLRFNNVDHSVSPIANNSRKTHCKRGHPFDESNTRIYRGGRNCRACHAWHIGRYRELRK